MIYRIEVFKDGGQWFARIHQDDALWWEGWLCQEKDDPKVVAAVALGLAITDSGQHQRVKQLAERGVNLNFKEV